MAEEKLDTAHEYWDEWWGDAKGRPLWSQPDPAVTDLIAGLKDRGATSVLDVGTGIGRHALAYAVSGLKVIAIDASSTGLDQLSQSAAERNLSIDTRLSAFTRLPVDSDSIDHVLAWNVLYHGDADIVAQAFSECHRVLKDEGTFQLTMLSKRNRAFGVGEQVRPDTFVDKESKGDKDHPHFYADAVGVSRLLSDAGFDVRSLDDVDQSPPGGYHWVVLAERR